MNTRRVEQGTTSTPVGTEKAPLGCFLTGDAQLFTNRNRCQCC